MGSLALVNTVEKRTATGTRLDFKVPAIAMTGALSAVAGGSVLPPFGQQVLISDTSSSSREPVLIYRREAPNPAEVSYTGSGAAIEYRISELASFTKVQLRALQAQMDHLSSKVDGLSEWVGTEPVSEEISIADPETDDEWEVVLNGAADSGRAGAHPELVERAKAALQSGKVSLIFSAARFLAATMPKGDASALLKPVADTFTRPRAAAQFAHLLKDYGL